MNEQILKVLVVDDEYLIRNLIRMRIDWASIGLEIVGEAGNAEEAMPLVEALKPDIIFTDICMPATDGIDFAREVLNRWPHIRIAAITGHDDFAYAQRSIRAGLVDYLLKPINAQELMGVAERMKQSIQTQQRLAHGGAPGELAPMLSRLLSYMQENMGDSGLNPSRTAATFYVSVGHLNRLIRQGTDKSFVEYLTDIRIEAGKTLLRTTDLPAYLVGQRVGIQDSHYFSILFKKHTGMTPKQYREQAKMFGS